ncbi:host specificity factor TipJ family phage tail protein [Acinetobacter chinensis]|uniref:Host specificity factor TipJ family phage tail protein n=1 Tax=Acinetobacter chinensis TaxID=2004650 RepID=A0ABU3WDD8_9GAMM|nr:host specificity factor TipJ family phage tail protein [Acinetobacter chinensis]MDV2468337.1 host specificity factor TipJ family phage tail protein [Acinetobacter chinensis]
MSRLRIITNPLDANDGILHVRSDNVLKVFEEVREKYPQARIFLRPACQQNDVTPANHVDAAGLQMLSTQHDFDIVCCAGEPATILAVVSLVLSVGMAVYTYMNMPETPQLNQKSGNNELSSRMNRERINARVPDIFGKVKSIPDLIAPPVLYYREDGTEIEECLMCIGRGEFEISDIRDGETYGATIDGFAASVYSPGQSLTGVPQVQIGQGFSQAPLVAKKSSAVTGQTLEAWSQPVIDTAVEGTMYPQWPNRLYLVGGGLNAKFTVGESVIVDAEPLLSKDEVLSGHSAVKKTGILTVTVSNDIPDAVNFRKIQINTLLVDDAVNGMIDLAGFYDVESISQDGAAYEVVLKDYEDINPNWLRLSSDSNATISSLLTANTASINITGTYPTILNVTSEYLVLSIPSALQPEWDKLQGRQITEAVIELSKPTDNWLGWFYINHDEIDQLILNFYFPKGMYSVGTNGKNYSYNVVYAVEYQETDVTGAPVGQVYEHHFTSWDLKTYGFGLSKIFTLPAAFVHGVRIRVRKGGDVWVSSKTSRVNDLKLKSIYACSRLKKLNYPEVTLIRSRTVATDGALSVKERQLNCTAARKVHSYADGSKSPVAYASSDFADIVCSLHTDKLIGRREITTLDTAGLYETSRQIAEYFGTVKATEFNYTFDQSNTSYEETLAQIALCVGSSARRESDQIYLQFESENPDSCILFNHRNKKPYSETRTRNFGINRDFDGVEVVWVDPADNWTEKRLKLPSDLISNPKKVELKGVTNHLQAHFIAHRTWNRIQFHRKTVQFTAYGEADLVTLNDRIAVADDRIAQVISNGDITEWSGQQIRISQPARLDADLQYVIHLQMVNRSVETMRVTQGNSEFELVLERMPVMPLITGYGCSKYSVTLKSENDSEAFLITEKSSSGQFESQITAINYDSRYYANDKDHIKNLV